MTTLKQIKGQNVRVLATDPSDLIEGQLWYNSTDKVFKGAVYQPALSGAWSSGGNMSIERGALAGAGTQTAGLGFGGSNIDGSVNSNATEEYDGSAWTAGGNLNTTRRQLAGAGIQTAGLAFGGYDGNYLDVTEEYNGSSWSSGGNMNTARGVLAGAGIQTAGLAFGGADGNSLNVTEEYDGSSWSSGGNLNNTRYDLAGVGTQTAGLAFGSNPLAAHTEEYNGTSWTSVNSMNTARCMLAGAGIQTAGLAFGGRGIAPGPTGSPTGITGSTEEYDGNNWSSGGTLGVARYMLAGAGTQTAGLSFGGYYPSITTVTEEYTGGTPASMTVKTLTAS